METAVFDEFCAGVGTLTVAQIRQLGSVLGSMDARIEVLSRIDKRHSGITTCLYCGDTHLRRWGQTRTGLQRLRCQGCGKTFCSSSRTAMDRVRLPEAFLRVVADMFSAAPRSCRRLANDLDIDRMTAWRWRHRIIKAMDGVGETGFRGIVEADEKFFRESRKGSREWVNHMRDPANFPVPPRHRWRDYRRRKIKMKAGVSEWQIPVLTIADRSGARRADVLPNRLEQTRIDHMDAHLGPDPVLCTDGDPAYAKLAQNRHIPHYVLNAKSGPRVISKAFHIQNINNLHSRFEGFMRPFCGPATKHLQAYSAWFIARLIGDPKTATDAAWHRLMGA